MSDRKVIERRVLVTAHFTPGQETSIDWDAMRKVVKDPEASLYCTDPLLNWQIVGERFETPKPKWEVLADRIETLARNDFSCPRAGPPAYYVGDLIEAAAELRRLGKLQDSGESPDTKT